jgi:hypothetical protein
MNYTGGGIHYFNTKGTQPDLNPFRNRRTSIIIRRHGNELIEHNGLVIWRNYLKIYSYNT